MAIQAQMYQENLGLPLISGGSQDWLFMYNNNNNQNNFNNNNLSTNNNNNNDNNNNNNMSFNGCGYNEYIFHNNIQQKQQQQQQEVLLQLQQEYYYLLQNQRQKNNNYDDDLLFLSSSKNNCESTTTASTTTTTTRSDYHMPLNFSPFFVDEQLEKQRQEIDRFITLQNERLKMALQEQRKQQLSTIMSKLEAKAIQILTQKDEEIARATKRTIELEDIITKLEIETQEWKRSAIENEAMVASLKNTLEQIKEPICCSTTSSSSTCCNNNNNVGVFNNKEKSGVLCKVCKSEKCCILMLPCRHLCCCKRCEPFVDACPVCKAAKMASIEALIS